MDIFGVVILLLVACVSWLLISIWRKRYYCTSLPPGPPPMPILGNLLQLNTNNLFQSLLKLSTVYGPVFTIYLGSLRVVVLSGYEAIKEALIDHGDEFSGRGSLSGINRFLQETGVVFSNGERWKQLRRFSLMTLRDFGMGKRTNEERILEEAEFLVEELKKTKERLIDPTLIISGALSNVICLIVFNERFDYEDPQFLALLNLVFESSKYMSSFWGQLVDMFPSIMKHLPGGHRRFVKLLQGLQDFISEKVKINQETLDPNNPRDFVDCFLIRMEKEKHKTGTEFTMQNLLSTVLNLFFAGTETVSTTIRYGLLILLKHPDIEEKIHEEIDRVIGQDRSPSIDDRSRMPYTDAVIHEIQRFINISPMSVPHRVTRDTKFRGYLIPKDTEVFAMLGSVLWNPTFFPNPEKFNPRNFLDDAGSFKKSEGFIPFSAGKRICLGEGLARMELFLFLTSVLQKFTLKPPADLENVNLTPYVTGIGNLPEIYQLRFVSK